MRQTLELVAEYAEKIAVHARREGLEGYLKEERDRTAELEQTRERLTEEVAALKVDNATSTQSLTTLHAEKESLSAELTAERDGRR